MSKALVARALAALIIACATWGYGPGAARAQTGPVDAHYEATGPWGLATHIDRTTLPGYYIYRPTTFGTRPGGQPYSHPVITWGVGTSFDAACADGTATPSLSYRSLFDLYASWGYVVVASNDCWVNTGAEQKYGAEAAVFLDAVAGNHYSGKLDEARIAAMGHSQGAIGSINAAKQTSFIKTVVAFALPTEQLWFGTCLLKPPEQEPCNLEINGTQLAKPTFFVSGNKDALAPQAASQWVYDEMANSVPKARADEKQVENPAVTHANYPLNGMNNHIPVGDGHLYVPGVGRGYTLAWLDYRLYGNTYAKRAFVGTDGAAPEIQANTAEWQRWARESLA